jgi:GNAT superfamily N-acetyltransferase
MTAPNNTPARDWLFRDQPRPADIDAVREIVGSTGYFHDFEIDVAVELVQERLDRGAASEYFFAFADDQATGRTIGYTCFGPIACTISSVDLYWIAVHESVRGRGLGLELMARTERQVLTGLPGARTPFDQPGQDRRVYIETSGKAQYAPTRAFYTRAGYTLGATLESFYAPGDDKLVYVKRLG